MASRISDALQVHSPVYFCKRLSHFIAQYPKSLSELRLIDNLIGQVHSLARQALLDICIRSSFFLLAPFFVPVANEQCQSGGNSIATPILLTAPGLGVSTKGGYAGVSPLGPGGPGGPGGPRILSPLGPRSPLSPLMPRYAARDERQRERRAKVIPLAGCLIRIRPGSGTVWSEFASGYGFRWHYLRLSCMYCVCPGG